MLFFTLLKISDYRSQDSAPCPKIIPDKIPGLSDADMLKKNDKILNIDLSVPVKIAFFSVRPAIGTFADLIVQLSISDIQKIYFAVAVQVIRFLFRQRHAGAAVADSRCQANRLSFGIISRRFDAGQANAHHAAVSFCLELNPGDVRQRFLASDCRLRHLSDSSGLQFPYYRPI